MAIPGPYAPPPAPPKRSNALPLLIALGATFGVCLFFGIIGWVGYRWLSTAATEVPDVPPKVVRSYEDGWKRYELGSIGMTVDLPAEPERIELGELDSPVSLYDRQASYEAYDGVQVIDVYAYRHKMAGTFTPMELAQDHRSVYLDPDAQGVTEDLKQTIIAGHPGAFADFAYTVNKEPEYLRTAVVIVGSAEYTLTVVGYGDTAAKAKRMATVTLDRMLKSLELKPESAAMMK